MKYREDLLRMLREIILTRELYTNAKSRQPKFQIVDVFENMIFALMHILHFSFTN